MADLSDVELQRSSSLPPEPGEPRSKAPWIALAFVIAAAGAVWFFVASSSPEETAAPATDQAAQPAAPSVPAAAPPAVDLPPLADSDALVRKLVGALSSNPTVARWLATRGLIRNFVVVVENIAYGTSPARHLTPLRPVGPFRVTGGEDNLRIDPRNYSRYTSLAAAVDSIDAGGAARLYTLLKPRLDEAYAELGRSEPFDIALERAIVALVQTPALEGSVPLVPKGGVMYAFGNPKLERLTAPQKQLARMGPANARLIQNKLRQIGLAIGIPEERFQ